MHSRTVRIRDTLTGEVKELKPVGGSIVKMYVCGQTVYDHAHVGHGRTYVVYDVLERLLKYLGYSVIKVINITDVDDKIIKRANELGISIKELTEKYTLSFIEDLFNLNILLPENMPRATHYIEEMIKIIQALIDKGYAYVSDGNVYFDVSKMPSYGELSKQSPDKLIAGYRVEPGEGKRNPLDFALWKKAKPGEPCWMSPWGEGRPGWHIECSAMSMKLLGEVIDIHGGGEDLIFPHHENEKAQSEAVTGKRFVNVWMHVGLLTFKKEKMAKSVGNVVRLKDALDKYGSDALRIYYLMTHYRDQLDFDWSRLEEAKEIAERIRRTYERLMSKREVVDETDEVLLNEIAEFRGKIIEALLNDLNTPLALSTFLSFIKWLNAYLTQTVSKQVVEESRKLFEEVKFIFGLRLEEREAPKVRDLIELLVYVREQLRREKRYDLADLIRSKLGELGIELEDVGDRTVWRARG